MKMFYSCVDASIPSPFSEQHIVINKKASMENGAIVAYAAEEIRAINKQPWIFNKLKTTPGLHGVIFFTAIQFLYGDNFNYKLFNKILNAGYEIHFARENMSFTKKNKNLENLNFLTLYSLVVHRNENELLKLI